MGSFLGGFIKGLVVGLGSFALGFAVLTVFFPVEDAAPPHDDAPAEIAEEASPKAPSRELPPLVARNESTPKPASAAAPDAVAEPGPDAEPAPAPKPETGDAVTPADSADAPKARTSSDKPVAAAAPAAVSVIYETGNAVGATIPAVPPEPTVAFDAPTAREELPVTREAGEAGIAGLAALPRPVDSDDAARLPITAALPPDAPASETEQPETEQPEAARPEAAPAASEEAPEAQAPDAVSGDDAGPQAHEEAPASGDTATDRPQPGLQRPVEGVVVGRLPSIGNAEPGPDDLAEDPDAVPDIANPVSDLPAYLRYAARYENHSGLPLMAILFLDTVADDAAEAALLALDFSTSIVLDPADEDAPRRAALYREAGHEIVLKPAGLPPMATASDIEVNFAAWGKMLPEIVAMIDTSNGVLRGNVMLARNVLSVLAEDGHGLILRDGGLGGLRQVASGEGVASARVFRGIDDDDENRHRIRRYLDRAVFEAQQHGQVLVTGRAAHAETIAAIALWRSQGRAGDVTLAPVSAVLQVQ